VAVAGDVDDDGHTDLVFGAPAAGALDVGYVATAWGDTARFSGVQTVVPGVTGHITNLQFGGSIAALGDFDGDGHDDLAFGTPSNEAWLIYGGPRGDGQSLRDVPASRFLGRLFEAAGADVAGPGDLDDDGLADWVISAHDADDSGQNAGGAYVVYGTDDLGATFDATQLAPYASLPSGTFPTVFADDIGAYQGAHLVGGVAGQQLGRTLGHGDLKGDGIVELVLGAPDAGHVEAISAGPYGVDFIPGSLPADTDTWVWDRDVDGQGTDTLESFDQCPMHVPVALQAPGGPQLRAILEADGPHTDCDDSDASIYLDAPEIDDDGIDRDCDTFDNINKIPVATVSMNTVGTEGPAVAVASATDADLGTPGETPVTLFYTWFVDGVLVPGETSDRLPGVHFVRDQEVRVEVFADDNRDPSPVVSASFTVRNTTTRVDDLTVTPASPTDLDDLTVTAIAAVDVDGDATSVSCRWEQQQPDGSFDEIATGTSLTNCEDNPACSPGDTVRASCRVHDGIGNGPWERSPHIFIDPCHDRDGDGATICDADCDDTEPLAFPGASEVDFDGIDRDCDGFDSTNRVPVASVFVAPVGTEGPAVAVASATDGDAGTPDETPITYSYAWSVNGTPVGGDTPTLAGSFFSRDQTVQVRVIAHDGRDPSQPVETSFVVQNTPPVLDAVVVTPDPATDLDELTATLDGATDADGDNVTFSCFWQRQTAPDTWTPLFGQNGPTLGACTTNTTCSPGDVVRATCVPYDGQVVGLPVPSDPVFIDPCHDADGDGFDVCTADCDDSDDTVFAGSGGSVWRSIAVSGVLDSALTSSTGRRIGEGGDTYTLRMWWGPQPGDGFFHYDLMVEAPNGMAVGRDCEAELEFHPGGVQEIDDQNDCIPGFIHTGFNVISAPGVPIHDGVTYDPGFGLLPGATLEVDVNGGSSRVLNLSTTPVSVEPADNVCPL
jgi:hypothetical protein